MVINGNGTHIGKGLSEGVAEPFLNGFQNVQRLLSDLRANTISGKNSYFFLNAHV